MKKKKNKKKNDRGAFWFLGTALFSVSILIACQFLFSNINYDKQIFGENTKINGLDVGGMSIAEAENVVLTDMLNSKNEIEIELLYKDKSWTLNGQDFEVCNNLKPVIVQLSKKNVGGEENENDFQISYAKVFSNIDSKIDLIVDEIEREEILPSLIFNPNSDEIFSVDIGQTKLSVDKEKLKSEIDNSLSFGVKAKIEIPVEESELSVDLDELKNSVGLRSEFVTSYATSSANRKHNVAKALENFNGMIVQQNETVSFNDVTGDRTENNGYKNARIIVGGTYVDGVGGGVCQASTTLYNALLLADIDIDSVSHHTLPASYVPLSLDSMVSGDYSDLVFTNNLDVPLYIKTFSDDKNVGVQIYGQKLDDGVEIKTRSEVVAILPHNGDLIVSDDKGEYEDKILYKGEYLRLKYPREGYESKAYLQYFRNNELEKEVEIRHDFYQAQDGVVIEGVEDIVEGMAVPESNVKIITPQKVTDKDLKNIKNRLEKTNPSQFGQ